MNETDLTEDQQERLINHFWRFDGVDISDVPASVREEFFSQLSSQTSSAEIDSSLESRLPKPKVSSGSGPWKGLISGVLICLFFGGVFSWMQSAKAERSRVESQSRIVDRMSEIIFGIYEENPLSNAQLLDQLDEVMLLGQIDQEDSDQAKLFACRMAARSLLASRHGHPSETAKRLSRAKEIMRNDEASQSGLLDFLFYLIVGKASLEANDIESQRIDADGSSQRLRFSREEAVAALLRAQELLDNGAVNQDLAEDKLALLRASLLTDLARAKMRYADSQSSKVSLVTDAPKQLLDQCQAVLIGIEPQSSQSYLATVRELNNRLLLSERSRNREEIAISKLDFIDYFSRSEAKVESVCRLKSIMPVAQASAIRFEQALCYTNLADISYNWHNYSHDQSSEIMDKALMHRQEALRLLNSIPHSERTERCKENILLNRVRSISDRIRFSPSSRDSQNVKWLAQLIDQELGGVLKADVGQFPRFDRLTIASVLTNVYTDEELLDYGREIESDFRMVSRDYNLKSWFVRLMGALAQSKE